MYMSWSKFKGTEACSASTRQSSVSIIIAVAINNIANADAGVGENVSWILTPGVLRNSLRY